MMKKNITRLVAVFVLLFIGSSAFAQYSGDVQLVLGRDHQNISVDDDDFGWKANAFDIGLKSFNTYEFANFFGIGFLGSCDLSLGSGIHTKNSRTPDMDFLIGFDLFLGPAITVKFKDIIALQGSVGIDWQYMAILGEIKWNGKNEDYYIYEKSMGFGFDIQAKLFPTAPISAVLGVKSVFLGSDDYKVEIDGDSETIDKDFDLNSFKFYAGVACKL